MSCGLGRSAGMLRDASTATSGDGVWLEHCMLRTVGAVGRFGGVRRGFDTQSKDRAMLCA